MLGCWQRAEVAVNGGRFEINQLLFANDSAPVADSEENCRLVSEFGRVFKRRKLRVKSKVMRYLRYGNGGRMNVILHGELFEEGDYFKHLGSQEAADRGCERDVVHRMNEWYRACGVLKTVLTGDKGHEVSI